MKNFSNLAVSLTSYCCEMLH